ncbi:MAG: S41 family peptidase [Anaeromicrobium sp.]|uniref:S41 family peptidase n=1 Tax=Anaeromicrobium sp. TaxID=1929132 RepID=UPI0025F8854D|nr:S41 family peptidase [Anaeromicrobium sp.]MCT4593061.1 S41 family peptidase [Anaeromicrobium sp.]
MKTNILTIFLTLLLIQLPVYETFSQPIKTVNHKGCINCKEKVNEYKEDYKEACTLLAKNYIYLEEKLNVSRDEFLKECIDHAETVDWSSGKETFVSEIRKLMAKFKDGHIYWQLEKELWPYEKGRFLGVVLTLNKDDKIYVGKAYKGFTDELSIGDEILTWNGKVIKEEIKRMGRIIPASTKASTNEKVARRLTLEIPFQPLRENFDPVKITYRNKEGKIKETTLTWKDCSATITVNKIKKSKNPHMLLLTKGMQASLEDIPDDARYIHPSLIFYTRKINATKYVILHPRDFYQWEIEDLKKTFELIEEENPDVLVIDLKDTAGGNFNQVLYLAHVLNVEKPFDFQYDFIDKETGERTTGVDDFDFISKKIHYQKNWDKKLFIRINPMVASGGDYFTRWMQLNRRGVLFGLPTAGAGGGTDYFELKNTKTIIHIPLRDRKLLMDDKGIEGNSVMPDYIFDGELMDFFKEYKIK